MLWTRIIIAVLSTNIGTKLLALVKAFQLTGWSAVSAEVRVNVMSAPLRPLLCRATLPKLRLCLFLMENVVKMDTSSTLHFLFVKQSALSVSYRVHLGLVFLAMSTTT